ncbi:AraC family transcriptional regulator [Chitinophaga sp. Cy-1792]|uniref:AraC family transcriptional regulator n=1 Tax=Chitinophaga sp. Cy-1792 TaxID=2608339 RepID=UPI001423EC90|nr:helix-turn-helix domain-containing protein [Chitinophaga sp. Cy-1792]NIG52684.1 AraC family transcriptional regulator [Chitinophaga sp. Cy-1792]
MSSKKVTLPNSIRTQKMSEINNDLLLFTDRELRPKAPVHGSFAIYSRKDTPVKADISASRRDYYKIVLITKGTGIYTVNDRQHEIDGPTLIFLHPDQVKSWHATSEEQDGTYILFNEHLFENQQQEILNYPLLQREGQAVYKITDTQTVYLASIFRQLMKEFNEDAAFKQEAILIYLKLVLLEGRRIAQEEAAPVRQLTAAQMLAFRFTDKLEKQFPIEHPHQQVTLKTAKEFATFLNTHPNHLNACVKHTTGRTVSEHIRQRVVLEAKLLLIHTDWPIADIAWSLGYEDPGNFTHFFQNHCHQSPNSFRHQSAL